MSLTWVDSSFLIFRISSVSRCFVDNFEFMLRESWIVFRWEDLRVAKFFSRADFWVEEEERSVLNLCR